MHILVAYDGSYPAEVALQQARKMAQGFDNSRIVVLTSLKGGLEMPKPDLEKAEENLRLVKQRLAGDRIPVETRISVRGLEPGEDLVKFARDNDVGLIVLGLKKHSKVGKLLFGSTAQYVILEAPCPVLTVK